MFKAVVVGIDGRGGGRDALALAHELTDPAGSIVLSNVYIAGPVPARGEISLREQRVHARELLEAERRQAGIDAELAVVAAAHVGRGLHELAEDGGADLIVVGSSRRGLWHRVWQGDDMHAALNGAPCAVAIAPNGYAEQPHALSEIGVGYDGSPESQFALEVARDLAERHRARLSAFEAVSLDGGYADPRHPSGLTLEEYVDQARRRLAKLEGVEPHAAYGDAAEELALFGASVDLLIVGSRGFGPLGRLIHGSTSTKLARTARCPLLVLPRSARTAAHRVEEEPQAAAGASA